jgi:DNA invertase Pin-like site-specific DNA recombinase
MTRALILCRQSLTNRESVSLDHQEERGRAYCADRAYDVVGVIREESTRGWKEDRESMAEIRRLAERGGFDVLIAYDTSRVARKLRLLENLIHDLARRKVRLECPTQEWVANDLYRQILGAFDEERSREIGRHVSGAVRVRAAKGQTWGRVPFGYIRTQGALIPHDTEAPVVADIYRWWLSGLSTRRIAERLNADAVPTHTGAAWERDVVSHLLKNPVYAGDVRSGGRVVARDAHAPLVDRAAWDAAQARFTAPKPRDKPGASSWAEGRVLHGCGARMYLVTMPDRDGRSYASFRCHRIHAIGTPCPLPSRHLSKRLLEEAVRRCLIADLRGAIDPAAAIRRLRRQSGASATVAARQGIERELAEVAAQRREAEALILQRRRDLAWLDARDAEFAREEARLTAKLAALPAVPDEGALVAAAAEVVASRRGIVAMDGAGLGALLARVGVAVVGESGVSIRYDAPFDALVPCPVTVDPRATFVRSAN